MTMDISLSESELISEVRDSLGQMDSTKIPDDTITQNEDNIVTPLLNEILDSDVDQDKFDNAVIAWTAELSFASWLSFTRLRDAEVESYIDPESYLEDLRYKTDLTLQIIGVTRPPQTPNKVVTIKHDGKKRKVNLQKGWEFQE